MNLLTLASSGGWRPFIDPVDIHSFWYLLLIPISFFISVAYKAARVRTLSGFWTAVVVMTVQIVLGMIALAVVLYLLVQVYPRVLNA